MKRVGLAWLVWLWAAVCLGQDYPYQSIGMGGGGGMFTPAVAPADHNFWLLSSDMSGCYRSLDGGRSWRMIHHKQISGANGCKPAFHPTNEKVVVWLDRLSTDKGRTWRPLRPDNPPWGKDRISHAVCLSDSTICLGSSSGVWLTRDLGRTWQRLASGPCRGLAATAQDTVYFAVGDRLYRLVAGAAQAVPLPPLPDVGEVRAVAAASERGRETVHVATASGLFTSHDAGRSWRQTRKGELADVVVAANRTQVAYCCNRKEVFVTTDGGRSWSSCFRMKENVEPSWVQTELYWGYYIVHNGLNVCPNDPSIVLVSTQGDFYVSRDGGGHWKPVMNERVGTAPSGRGGRYRSIGLEVTTCWDYYFDPHDPLRHYIAYTDIGFAYSVDGGQTWSYGGRGSPWSNTFYGIAFDPFVRGRLYAACSRKHDIPHWTHVNSDYRPGGVCVSTDGGMTWRPSSTGLPKLPACGIAVDPRSRPGHTTLYVTMYGDGVYKSTDGGRTWHKKPGVGREGNRHVYQVSVHEKSGAVYVSVTGNRHGSRFPVPGGLWKSSDGGESWTELTAGLRLGWPTGFAVHPQNPDVIFLAACSYPGPGGDQGGLYKTTNGGRTWKHVLKNRDFGKYVHAMFVTFHPDDPDIVYLGTTRGLWATNDGGTRWYEVEDFPFRVAHRVRIDPRDKKTMYVTTFGGGVWRGPTWTGPGSGR